MMPPPAPPMAPGQPGGVQRPNNYLVQSILVTLFCCLPLGIVSIVFAAQVNGKFDSGDYAGALDASKKAKTFCWVSFGIGGAFVLVYLLIFGLSFITAIMQSH